MNKRETLISIGLVVWVFIVEPLTSLSAWAIRRCTRFIKKYPRFTVCSLALIGGGVAEWQSLSTSVYDGSPMATAWSITGAVLLLGVMFYAIYRVATAGPDPLGGTVLASKR